VDDVPPEELTGALSAYDAFDQALRPDATLPEAEGDEDAADGGPSSGCPRCGGVLAFAGTQRFDPPIGWTVSVERGERRVEHERFDVYACRRCGHLEFGLARDRGGPSGRV
jgi:ribosomal protein S27AE